MWYTYIGPSAGETAVLSVTTSRLCYVLAGEIIAELGVMRPNGNFSAPYLWLVPWATDRVRLRDICAAANLLHDVLFEPVIFAECRSGRDEHFLLFCGFTFVASLDDRLLVQKVRT